jgi:hypothetical protein
MHIRLINRALCVSLANLTHCLYILTHNMAIHIVLTCCEHTMKQIPNFKNYKITKTGKIFGSHGELKQTIHGKYLGVDLFKNGKRYSKFTHSLVLETFIGPRPPRMECNHKDGNKLNNHILNLEWITKLENSQHAFKLGLIGNQRYYGETNPNSKLKKNEIWLIKKLLKAKISKIKISKMFKVHRQTIIDINNKRTWNT